MQRRKIVGPWTGLPSLSLPNGILSRCPVGSPGQISTAVMRGAVLTTPSGFTPPAIGVILGHEPIEKNHPCRNAGLGRSRSTDLRLGF
jgi:hypothetical protein